MSDANPNEPVTETPPPAPSGDTITIPVTEPEKKDPQFDPSTGEPQGKTFTAADIERARQEEKDKLYGRLQTMESEVQRLAREREERETAEAEARRLAEEAERRAAEEEMSARELIEARDREWRERFTALEQQSAAERALFERERQFQQLREYREQRIAAEADNLMPELLDLVTGNSQEEIDNSIALVRAKTDAILEQMRAATPPPAPVPPQRGASVTAPPIGPMDNESAYQTLTAEDIAAMDMNTYAQYRDKLMTGLQNRVREKGLFG